MGKQTVKQLVGQNQGVSNIEISDDNIKSFDRLARKYGVDYAVKKDRSVTQPKYFVFFKARDAEMKNTNFKKLLIPDIPYVFIALLATKLGQGWRLTPGTEFAEKVWHYVEGSNEAFTSAVPSFHPTDLLVGVAIAGGIKLAVYIKGKNANIFRKNTECGSARWGSREDIAPYFDPVFRNNIILTQTERLMMSGRPKYPKTARNKNVLVLGGSGSGKTRFFIKPNLMQMHSS